MRNLVAGIIVSLSFAFPVFSQNINMSNGSGTACSGTFYDNGGNGNYSNNQTITYTICPSVAGNRVVMNFSTFALENNYDFLTIYDGNNTSAPTLGTYTGNSGPGLVSATSTNTSGCLTFVFISNSSGVAAGWVAAISCATPCQTITSNLVSSSPATNSGIIRVCQGQTVTFNGSGTFSNSGAGATYLWSFGDGTTGSGTSVTHTYPNPGSYLVNLTITDPSGCHNSNHLNQVVQVSTTPTINLTASPATLCVGATAALNATVTPTPFTANCTPPVSGTTFLPDGSGVSYTTAVNVNCYGPFQTVSSASDIQSVCLNLEHSYLGDLRIRLICPNGQSMTLKAYPGGGGTYLGSPLDDPAVGPGTGSTYCFTPSATTLLVNGPTVTAGSPSGNSIVAGNYMPVDPFSNMVGCPLNGAWTIEVTDNLAVDNGYIFNWDVTFAPGLTPANLSFTPTIVSQGWVPAAGLTNVNATQANVTPAVPGSNCYTYSVTDNFGCTYTQNICVNATAGPTVNVTPATLTICAGQTINLSATGATSYTWTGPNGFTANTANISIPNATVAAGGTYTVIGTNASGCSTTVTRNVVVNPLPATPNFTVNSPLCTGNTLNLNGPTVAGATYVWSGPNGFSSSLEDPSVASVTAAAAGTYSLYVVVGGCTSATATRTVVVNPTPATPNFTTNSPVCAGGTLNLNGPTVAGATYVWSGPNGFSSSVEDPSISAVTAAAAGTYSLYVVVNGCTSATATQNVVINPLPPTPNFTTNSPLCQGQQLNLYGPNIAGANYYWSGPGGFTQSGTNANIGNVTVANAGTYSLYVVVSGCTSATATQNVVINPTPATPNFTSNSPICAGGTLSFNAPAVAGATYVWSGPNGFTSALEDPSITSVTTAASGTYSLYTVVSGCTSATATGNVVVNPIPATPNFTTNSPVCAGFTLNLNGPTVAGATYVWSGPNGLTSSLEDPSITSVTTAASGTYSLYVVVSGCTSATATQTVTVNPIPATPVFTTNSPVCAGFTLNLNGPTVAGATYVWSGPNGFTSALEDPSITSVTTAASGTYSLYVVVNGCTSATATRTVTINPIPATPNFTTNSPVCAGFTLNFNAPTVAGATYVWSGPNGFTSALEDPSITSVTTAASGTYSLYVVVNGCTSATATQNVIINPIPATPNFTTNSPICAGSTLSLNGPTVAGATYVWSGPNGFSSSLEDPSVTSATTAASGTYSLYVVVNGCTSATATQNVTVYPIPATPNFTTNSPVCAGFTLNLNGPTVAGATYVWSGPNGFTSSVEDPSITSVTTAASGTYSLYVVVNGC
ncbi:MAG: PKD domain-containing protein, partial [Flavobacteriales bacterium]